MTAPGRASGEVAWDVSFLRVGAVITAAVTVPAAAIGALAGGGPVVAGVVVGAVIVTAFFAVSGLAVAWAGRIGDTLTMPVALLTFMLKALVLFAVLQALPADGWIDRRALAWAVVVGALLWSGVQMRWVWTRQLYYVPPPAPPPAAPPAPRSPDRLYPDQAREHG